MKLGCLKSRLAKQFNALKEEGIKFYMGWIANQLDPEMPVFEENIKTLQSKIAAPLLTIIPWSYNSEISDLIIKGMF